MRLLKVIWLIACVAVLVWGFIACGQESNSTLRGECSLLAGYVLAMLNVPLSIAWWLVLSAAGYGLSLMGVEIGESPMFGAVAWLGFIVFGYLQWFKLVPWLIERWRSRRAATIGRSR